MDACEFALTQKADDDERVDGQGGLSEGEVEVHFFGFGLWALLEISFLPRSSFQECWNRFLRADSI